MSFVLSGICLAQTPAAVKVEGGMVQGATEDGLTVYRGIPFAAPPVGDLRWREPQPAAKWEGGGRGGLPQGSEDCLYLNVWTPAKSPQERVPVLAWI